MRSEPITKELREYVGGLYDTGSICSVEYDIIDDIADAIDNEHKRRMADSRREMRRAAVRYMRSVFDDYYHGIKRKRPQ